MARPDETERRQTRQRGGRRDRETADETGEAADETEKRQTRQRGGRRDRETADETERRQTRQRGSARAQPHHRTGGEIESQGEKITERALRVRLGKRVAVKWRL